MRKLSFISNLIYALRRRLGWCPEEPVIATPPISKPSKGGRPQGVTVISVLSVIGGLMVMVFGSIITVFGLIDAAMLSRGVGLRLGDDWYLLYVSVNLEMIGVFAAYLSVIGVIVFLGGFFFLFVGWGLWKGAAWAWTLEVILQILGLISGIITIPYGLTTVLVCGLILYYLFKPSVKACFNKTVDANRHRDTEGTCDESDLFSGVAGTR